MPPEVYRSFGFPGADDLGNMFVNLALSASALSVLSVLFKYALDLPADAPPVPQPTVEAAAKP